MIIDLPSIDPTRICYVCGFNFNDEALEDLQKWPFIFCPCCCFEYGFEDLEFDCFTERRTAWIKNGLRFGCEPNVEKEDWNLHAAIMQLQNLKLVKIDNYINGVEMNPNFTNDVDIDWAKREWHKNRIGGRIPDFKRE